MKKRFFRKVLVGFMVAVIAAVMPMGFSVSAEEDEVSRPAYNRVFVERGRVNTWHASGGDAFHLLSLFDENYDTFWHGNWGGGGGEVAPDEAFIDLDLGFVQMVGHVELTKRVLNNRGMIADARAFTHGHDGDTWPNGELTWPYQTDGGVPQEDIDADFAMDGWTQVSITAIGLTDEGSVEQRVVISFNPPVETRYIRIGIVSIHGGNGNPDMPQLAQVRVFSDVEISPEAVPLSDDLWTARGRNRHRAVSYYHDSVTPLADEIFMREMAEILGELPDVTSGNYAQWRERVNGVLDAYTAGIVQVNRFYLGAMLFQEYGAVERMQEFGFTALYDATHAERAAALAVFESAPNFTQAQVDAAIATLTHGPVLERVNVYIRRRDSLYYFPPDDIAPEAIADAIAQTSALAGAATTIDDVNAMIAMLEIAPSEIETEEPEAYAAAAPAHETAVPLPAPLPDDGNNVIIIIVVVAAVLIVVVVVLVLVSKNKKKE